MENSLVSSSALVKSSSFNEENERVLFIRLPCNPIFPIGPIYLADHLHKCFPRLQQRIIDLATVPIPDVETVLISEIKDFKPSFLVFSLRDIQIYAPVEGRGGNPLQHSFEVFYSRNPLRKIRGAMGLSLIHISEPTRPY